MPRGNGIGRGPTLSVKCNLTQPAFQYRDRLNHSRIDGRGVAAAALHMVTPLWHAIYDDYDDDDGGDV